MVQMGLVQFKFPAFLTIIRVYLRLCFCFADVTSVAARRVADALNAQLILELHNDGSSEIGAKFKLDKPYLDYPKI